MGFVSDLQEGEAFEQDIRKELQDKFAVLLEKNENKKGVDLVHPLINAEVKFDRMMEKTGNLFIEIGYK